MQAWTLQRKIQVTQTRLFEWWKHYDGKICISFSGGKDSTVLADLAARMYRGNIKMFPERAEPLTLVFVNTGLEYPEIQRFVRDFAEWLKSAYEIPVNLEIVRPKMTFSEVLSNYGYPVISKEVAKRVCYARKGRPWAIDSMQGNNPGGVYSEFKQRYKKYAFLVNANFDSSNYCCDVMKKNPLKKFQKENKLFPVVATMTCESQQREDGWLKTGCNSFDMGKSQPMSFWTEQDVLQYIKIRQEQWDTAISLCNMKILNRRDKKARKKSRRFIAREKKRFRIAPVYGEIVEENGQLQLFGMGEPKKLVTTGCDRTGCMFCMFGIMSDKTPNRFQRMKRTHPKQYSYCIGGGHYDEGGMLKPDKNGLGIGKVLDFLNIPY